MNVIWETQKAVYAKLNGDATLLAMVGGVYDHVPERSEFPYVTIGNIRAEANSRLGMEGYNLFIEVASYSKAKGRKENLEIMERIKILLEEELEIDGYSISQVKLLAEDSELLGDGETYRAEEEYKITLYVT